MRRHFRLFWTGDTISAFGGALSLVAVPVLAIETLHASATEVGLVRAAQTVPFLLLAIPIGLLADRVSRRRLLLTADAVRFPLMLLIALLAASLTVPWLLLLVFLAGIGAVAYEVAYLSALPELIDDPARLPTANRAVETAHAGAALTGPAAGGALIAALGPAGVIAIDAASFAVGALLTKVNRWPSPPRAAVGRPGLLAGGRWLWRDRHVRPLTLYLAVNNVAAQAFQTALLLFVLQTLGRSAAAVGLAVAAAGGGFLLGAAISPGAARRAGPGRVIVAAALVGAGGIGIVAAAGGMGLVVVGAALSGAGPGMLNLHAISIRQATAPPELLGRVNAVVKTVSYSAMSVGALLGGAVASVWGPRMVIAGAAAVSALAALIPAITAIRTLAAMPEISRLRS